METEDVAYHPHTKQVEESLYCFKDAGRICGPDCMAHDTPPDHKDFKGKSWAKCRLLVDSYRTGKNLVVLADCMNTVRTFIEDTNRNNQPIPPRPR